MLPLLGSQTCAGSHGLQKDTETLSTDDRTLPRGPLWLPEPQAPFMPLGDFILCHCPYHCLLLCHPALATGGCLS